MTTPATPASRLMTGQDFRDSLRRYHPTVYVDGQRIESVVDAPSLQPGINALAVTYDFAHDPAKAPLMTAVQSVSGKTVNRMLHLNESAGDLLNKLEAVRRCTALPISTLRRAIRRLTGRRTASSRSIRRSSRSLMAVRSPS